MFPTINYNRSWPPQALCLAKQVSVMRQPLAKVALFPPTSRGPRMERSNTGPREAAKVPDINTFQSPGCDGPQNAHRRA